MRTCNGVGRVTEAARTRSARRNEFDVENLVFKVYGYLSYHAQRVQTLKEHFADAEIEYQNIISRHVKTRWLSLHPTTGKILRGFPALKSYFITLGYNCPVVLGKYFDDNHAKNRMLSWISG